MTIMEKPDTATRRLTDMNIPLVSIVDLGANGEPFFIVKSKEQPMSGERDKFVSILSAIAKRIDSVVKKCDEDKDKVFDVAKILGDVAVISKDLGLFTSTSYSEMPAEVAKSYVESPQDKIYRIMWAAMDELARDGELLPDDEKQAKEAMKAGMRAAFASMSGKTEVESSAEGAVEKRGSKMAVARLTKLKESAEALQKTHETLSNLVSEMKSFIAEIESKKDSEEDMSGETEKNVNAVEKSATESVVQPVDKSAPAAAPPLDVAELMKSVSVSIGEAIAKALEPINKTVQELVEKNTKTDEKVEKMLLARDTPRGGEPEGGGKKPEKIEKSAETESLFASIMPEGLRGVVTRGK